MLLAPAQSFVLSPLKVCDMENGCPYCELHETFATIGFLVCDFANFEGRLGPALALMINDNGDQASAILGQVDSFSYKWGTVVELR